MYVRQRQIANVVLLASSLAFVRAHSQIADPRKGGSSEVGHRDRIG